MRMKMRKIELKTISCKGVGSLALFQRPSLSVAVALVAAASADGDDHQPTRRQVKETPINRDDGENPEWECPMLFDLRADEMDDLLEFELTVHGGLLLGDRIVGRVRVTNSELAEEARIVGPASFRFVTYQVLAPDGKPNGTLSFGFRMIDPDLVSQLSHSPAIRYHLPPVTTGSPTYYLSPPPDSPAYYLSQPPSSPAYYLSPPPDSPAYYLSPPQDSSSHPSYPHLSAEPSSSLYPSLSPEPSPSSSLYPHMSPEPSPSHFLYPHMSPEPSHHLYPSLSPPDQTSSFYPPPPMPLGFGYPPDFHPRPAYSPATDGGLQYYNHSGNYPPQPPAGAYGGCYPSENQPHGHRTDACDGRLYG